MTEMENMGGPPATLSQEGHGIPDFSPRPGVSVLKVTTWLLVMKLSSWILMLQGGEKNDCRIQKSLSYRSSGRHLLSPSLEGTHFSPAQ